MLGNNLIIIPVSYTHLDVYKRQGGKREMCEIWQKIRDEGYMEGEKIGKDKERMKLIKKLMMKNSCTIEDAMELLDIPPVERQQYRQRIVS